MTELRTTSADAFLLGLNSLMRRRHQGSQIGVTVVHLEGTPDIDSLRARLCELADRHPCLSARVGWSIPHWSPRRYRDNPSTPPSLQIGAVPGVELDVPDGLLWASREQVVSERFQETLAIETEQPHLMVDVVYEPDNHWSLILTWHHAILDGIGVNLLLRTLTGLRPMSDPMPPPAQNRKSIGKLLREAQAAVHYMSAHPSRLIASLGHPQKEYGDQRFEILNFSATTTEKIFENLATLGVNLVPSAVYLAIAGRAHRAVLDHRNDPEGILLSFVPQQSQAAENRPLFGNHVDCAITYLEPDTLTDLEGAVRSAQRKLAKFAAGKLRVGYQSLLRLMRHIPSPLYLLVPRLQCYGRFASFFHSYTGEFGDGMEEFLGSKILNGYNIPSVSSPPGTGLFFSVYQGQLSATLSWRDGVVSAEEIQLLKKSLEQDLLGNL